MHTSFAPHTNRCDVLCDARVGMSCESEGIRGERPRGKHACTSWEKCCPMGGKVLAYGERGEGRWSCSAAPMRPSSVAVYEPLVITYPCTRRGWAGRWRRAPCRWGRAGACRRGRRQWPACGGGEGGTDVSAPRRGPRCLCRGARNQYQAPTGTPLDAMHYQAAAASSSHDQPTCGMGWPFAVISRTQTPLYAAARSMYAWVRALHVIFPEEMAL